MRKYTNEIVMFLGISIAIGGLFPDFRNNQQLVVSITFSAVIFAIFDLVVSLHKESYKLQQFLLFIGIFSVVVVPYLGSLAPFLIEQNNYFTLFGLAVVIFLIGFRQNEQEREDYRSLSDKFNRQTDIIEEQNKVIKQQVEIIRLLNEKKDAENNPE
ncbi:hypothetical protein [Priestia abyssalis]|uniref:hypothetical protein n=1 Tax=Priestia abyssalis TaxID=1221450 RepID=UPI000994D2C1|nr:hypothetical protein [Priestia abyssalis]